MPLEDGQFENVIVVNNLMKKFGNFVAVNGLNLTVKEGEIFGFLGPNGAGKRCLNPRWFACVGKSPPRASSG